MSLSYSLYWKVTISYFFTFFLCVVVSRISESVCTIICIYISSCETHSRGPSWLTENFMLIVLFFALCLLRGWKVLLPSFLFFFLSFLFFLLSIESRHGRFNYKRQGRLLLSSFRFLRRNELYRCHMWRVCACIYMYIHVWTWLSNCVHTIHFFIFYYFSEAWKMFRIFLSIM